MEVSGAKSVVRIVGVVPEKTLLKAWDLSVVLSVCPCLL